MRTVQFDEGAIPNKYRELIGLGIAATTRCRYCTLFHAEIAKLFGATDAEIGGGDPLLQVQRGLERVPQRTADPLWRLQGRDRAAVAYVRSKHIAVTA